MKRLLLCLLITAYSFSASLWCSEDRYAGVKERLTAFIERGMKENGVTGVSIALVDEDEVVWQRGFGYADAKNKVPANEQTVYKTASISKLFTGVAVMQLVENGLVDLDSQLSTYIPEFSIKSRFENARPFTIRDMLTHHSGLPVDLSFPGVEPFSEGAVRRNSRYEQKVIEYLKTVHLAYQPGYVHSYSNIAYDLLAVVVERVSGMDYNDYMQKHVLAPLGMESASFDEFFLRDELGDRMALPHTKKGSGEKRTFPGRGAAGLSADVSDMSGFIKMLLARGSVEENRILKKETLQKMWTVQNEGVSLDNELKIGLSFFLSEKALSYAGDFYGHSGNFKHYHNSLKVLPDHGLGVIVSANSAGAFYFVHEVAVEALKEALKEKKGIEPPQENRQPVQIEAARLDDYTGLFGTVLIGPVGIEARRKKLFLNIMGLKLRLDLLDDGSLKARSFIKYFNDIYFQVVTIDGVKRLYARKGSYFFILGEDYERPNLDAQWLARSGTYVAITDEDGPQRVADIGDGQWKGSKKSFKLSYEKGLLTFNTAEWGKLLLKPLDDNSCLIVGLGRGANETIYFSEVDGLTSIRWAGYLLQKQ